MLKSRFAFVVAIIILFVLGISLFSFITSDWESLPVFPATVNRDCAPWDGSAFTVQIPWDDGDVINISIWQAPEIIFSKTFSFPDNTGQAGTVSLIHPSGLSDPLTGEVWVKSVSVGMPIEGRFSLKSESGVEFSGMFLAEWGDLVMLCG